MGGVFRIIPILIQKFQHFLFIPAIVMNSNVTDPIDTQGNDHVVSQNPNLVFGIPQIFVGIQFGISRPPLGIAAEIQGVGEKGVILLAVKDILVKVARVSLMGQGGRDIRTGKTAAIVDIDGIFCKCIQGRRQIKGRTQIIFQRLIYIGYSIVYVGSLREVFEDGGGKRSCLLYTSPSPRD